MSQISSKYSASPVVLVAAIMFGVLAVGVMQPAAAHERETMCGPVVDGEGRAVMRKDGGILLHGGSFPCPPEEAVVEQVAVEPISGVVFFDFDIDVPNGEGEQALQEIISALQDFAPSQVNVVGHADRAGSNAYNQDLSERRASNIAKRLIAGGIKASSVTVEALGETEPAVPTDDGVRNSANRRVEIDAAN